MKEAAGRLGVSTQRVCVLCQKGILETRTFGRRIYMVDPTSVEVYKKSPTRKAHTPKTFSSGRPPGMKTQRRKLLT